MAFYPIMIDLSGKKAVVIGGGMVAQRKVETLLEYGAEVHLISRELTPLLEDYVGDGRVRLVGRELEGSEFEGASIAIIATNDPHMNRRAAGIARERGVFVNVVDQPSDCDFIVPSILRRGDLIIAVSTSGRSPALAKRIRERLASQFGDEYGDFLRLMGHIREEVLSRGLAQEENSRIFHELVDSPIIEAVGREDWPEVASNLERILRMRFSVDEIINYLKSE
jgi:precorrin-2 dehydrogenase/sirohydrochlorin ferrochelatase